VDRLFTSLRVRVGDVRGASRGTPDGCTWCLCEPPHGVAIPQRENCLRAAPRISTGADFRLPTVRLPFYLLDRSPRHCPELLAEVCLRPVPRLHRGESAVPLIAITAAIRRASAGPAAAGPPRTRACPGRYDWKRAIADCKSGVTAQPQGRSGADGGECFGTLSSYGLGRARPIIRRSDSIFWLRAARWSSLLSSPHLVPMIRGIPANERCTCGTRGCGPSRNLQQLYELFYRNEPFVDVMAGWKLPRTRARFLAANVCADRGASAVEESGERAGGQDNLVRVAAGQRVQAMNIAFVPAESEGLTQHRAAGHDERG